MSAPKVSVCLPNVNNLQFLPERVGSVSRQSLVDWEMVVVDGYSNDGAWEFFQAEAGKDGRIRLYQRAREGIYPAINYSISLARGEYVYIATSDDTMPPDCLEKLTAALDAHPTCDIAHCSLKVLDAEGLPLDFSWDRVSVFARSCHGLLARAHIRQAPYDGLLHLSGQTVFNSLTQLLIRRSLFERIGPFRDSWGSASDFHWGMRAGLAANTIHVPHTWGGWRVHAAQATDPYSEKHDVERAKFEEMIDDAIAASRKRLTPDIVELLQHRRTYFFDRWKVDYLRNRQRGAKERLQFLLGELVKGSSASWHYIGRRALGECGWSLPPVEIVARWLSSLGYCPLREISLSASPREALVRSER